MENPPTPDRLRAIARGEESEDINIPCPFCGTQKLNTRLGEHLHESHRGELYRAIAEYRESNSSD